jgi:sporulation protein YlmC with PRC-barrel domain
MRTSEIAERPVVTLGGEDVAQVKDVVYAAERGAVVGFTLAGRGLFSGPLKQSLAWDAVLALGGDAVMIADVEVLIPRQDLLAASAGGRGPRGDVLGSQVLTDGGTALGTVIDVIIEVDRAPRRRCDVIGYEISAATPGRTGTTMLIPLPDTVAVSGEHLIVPASATDFVGDDLAGFGAAVEAFRAQLAGRVG